MKSSLKGKISRHPDGFGFLLVEHGKDIYIPKVQMQGIFTGDFVEVKLEHSRFKKMIKYVKVLERNTNQIIAQAAYFKKNLWVIPDKKGEWGSPLYCNPQGQKVEEGDYLAIKIETYPDSPKGFQGILVHNFKKMSSDKDSIRALFSYDLSQGFSDQVLQEANRFSNEVKFEGSMKDHRTDLSHLPFVTIDGATAKDFDDAICVFSEQDKGFRLYVAIADVSYYVKPSTALDEEAYQKGNSTYLGNYCEPMLPEVLSNGLCSLRPNENRLALVADIRIDKTGEVQSHKFYQALINSKARLTYNKVEDFLQGDTLNLSHQVEDSLRQAAKLAQIAMNLRFKKGSLRFDRSNVEVILNEAGDVEGLIHAERLFSHKLIEELMLITNQETGRFLKQKNFKGIHRVHGEPEQEKVEFWQEVLHNLGILQLGQSDEKLSVGQQMMDVQDKVKGTTQENFVSYLTLRTMQQAAYSAYNIGHFGLAFKDYMHFTSPIRRYSDLVTHRLIKQALGIPSYKVDYSALEGVGQWLSACERRSVMAERFFSSIKKARFMKNKVGEEYSAYISAITKKGVFVSIFQYPVEGLLPLSEMSFDEFFVNEFMIKGNYSGIEYHLGDTIEVILAGVDLEKGFLDFTYPRSDKNQSKKAPASKGENLLAKKSTKSFKMNKTQFKKNKLNKGRSEKSKEKKKHSQKKLSRKGRPSKSR